MIYQLTKKVNMGQNRYITLLLAKKMLARGVWELIFSKPDGYTHESGQFCQFFINKEDGEIVRIYSIGSAPHEDFLKFYVKFLPGGQGSQYFGNLEIGDQTKIGTAMGKFTVPADFEGLTMVATGVGVAPFFAFIKDQLDVKNCHKKLKLIFGVRAEDDLFMTEELETYQKKYQNFSYVITLSQPKAEGNWSGLRGRVTTHLLDELEVNHNFYICGSPPMVADVRKMLVDNSVDNKKIHLEAF